MLEIQPGVILVLGRGSCRVLSNSESNLGPNVAIYGVHLNER